MFLESNGTGVINKLMLKKTLLTNQMQYSVIANTPIYACVLALCKGYSQHLWWCNGFQATLTNLHKWVRVSLGTPFTLPCVTSQQNSFVNYDKQHILSTPVKAIDKTDGSAFKSKVLCRGTLKCQVGEYSYTLLIYCVCKDSPESYIYIYIYIWYEMCLKRNGTGIIVNFNSKLHGLLFKLILSSLMHFSILIFYALMHCWKNSSEMSRSLIASALLMS